MFKKVLAVLATGCLATSALLVSAGPAGADVIEPRSIYISVLKPPNASVTKVLDIREWSTENRGKAQLWDLRRDGDVRNQRWIVTKVGTLDGLGVYQLRNDLSGKCLDKSRDVPNANGNAVYQYECSSTTNQMWRFESIADSNFNWGRLRNLDGGRCLDVSAGDFSNGAPLHVWDCHGDWNQRWNIS